MSSSEGITGTAVTPVRYRAARAFPIVAVGLLLLGFGLRALLLTQNRFMEDEALYASWGVHIARGADPMLTYEAVDKPPLHPYLLALSIVLLGPSDPSAARQLEAAVRLPSLFASMAGIALTYALARQLYGDPAVGLLAALLLSLSPFDILFASTAYTDPTLTALALAALLAASKGRLWAAGLLAGLATATKQQGLLFLPLVVALGLACRRRHPARRIQWLWFVLAFAAVFGGAIGWDSARIQRPGFWLQSLNSYGGLRLAAASALPERARSWLRLLKTFWDSYWLLALVVAALAALPLLAARRRRVGHALSPPHSELYPADQLAHAQPAPSRSLRVLLAAPDAILGLFAAGFLLVHWLFTFETWDRYLLPLVPLLSILIARLLVTLGRQIPVRAWQKPFLAGVTVLLVVLLSGPVVRAQQGKTPIGGDHGAYDGIDELATYIRSHLPTGAVLYDYWLGYHYRFYLWGVPLRIHWYPDMADLVQDAQQYRREPRFISFPNWHDSTPARVALAEAGIGLVAVYDAARRDGSTSISLFRMQGP